MSSNLPAPMLASELVADVANWKIGNPQTNPKGGKSSNVTRNGQSGRIFFQTTALVGEDRCTAPFGISKPFGQQGNGAPVAQGPEDITKRALSLSVKSAGLASLFQAMDDLLITSALTNKSTWFPKKAIDDNNIRALHRPLLTPSAPRADGRTFDPTVQTKIYTEKADDPVTVAVFDKIETLPNGEQKPIFYPGTMADIKPFCELVAIMEVVGVWYMPHGFGYSLICTSILVYPKAVREKGTFNFGGQLVKRQVAPPPSAMFGAGHSGDMEIDPREELSHHTASVATSSGAEGDIVLHDKDSYVTPL